MRSLGSKAKIAKDIVPIIQSYIDNNSIEQYWEPFVGGANIIDKINCKVRVGTDIHPQLIALLQQAQTDISVFPDTISEEEYKEVALEILKQEKIKNTKRYQAFMKAYDENYNLKSQKEKLKISIK